MIKTTQCNVRVPVGDIDLMKAIAVRLKTDRSFRDQLAALLTGGSVAPALAERVAILEQKMERLRTNKALKHTIDGTAPGVFAKR